MLALIVGCSTAGQSADSSPMESTAAVPATPSAGSSAEAASSAPAPQPSVSGSAQPDPCALLSSADVGQALGKTVGAGSPAAEPAIGCSWIADQTGDNSNLSILYVERSMYDQVKELGNQYGQTLTPVPGLGDDAFSQTLADGGAPLLFVVKKDVTFTVSADIRVAGNNNAAPETDLAAEVAVAQKLVAKL
jgi:hypothetical protein